MTCILIVEDDPDLGSTLEEALSNADYCVTVVASANGAMALLDTEKYALVLTDGCLPDGTGIEVAEKAAERGMQVLILTGNGGLLPPEKLQRFDYLEKPVRIGALIEAVERRLRKREGA